MKKVKLNLSDLRVHTFATSAPSDERGTVVGNSRLQPSVYCQSMGCASDMCGPDMTNTCFISDDCFTTAYPQL